MPSPDGNINIVCYSYLSVCHKKIFMNTFAKSKQKNETFASTSPPPLLRSNEEICVSCNPQAMLFSVQLFFMRIKNKTTAIRFQVKSGSSS